MLGSPGLEVLVSSWEMERSSTKGHNTLGGHYISPKVMAAIWSFWVLHASKVAGKERSYFIIMKR